MTTLPLAEGQCEACRWNGGQHAWKCPALQQRIDAIKARIRGQWPSGAILDYLADQKCRICFDGHGAGVERHEPSIGYGVRIVDYHTIQAFAADSREALLDAFILWQEAVSG